MTARVRFTKATRVERAWAIMEHGELAVYDGQLPIYWHRSVAKQRGNVFVFEPRIARVEIREVPKARKRKAVKR